MTERGPIERVLARLSGSGGHAAPDARVLRRVRWRLVAWSAGATLVVLVVLGVAIYTAVAGSLASSGQQQLSERASILSDVISNPRLGVGPGDRDRLPIGFAFGGPSSGT
ncbi:MAG TPA: hypothetical protein VIV06_11370, partial [Candidatus Limnocylindrales bacterium]